MKSPKEDYEIRKSVVSETGTREDLLIFLSFNNSLFIMYLYFLLFVTDWEKDERT